MNKFIAVDFETADYNPNSAVSIGLVKYQNYAALDSFYSLICPPILYIRRDFTDIHGLTVNDVKDAPDFKQLWGNNIFNFIEDYPLAAHNAPFDMGVLKALFFHYNIEIPEIKYFCSLALARKTWPHFSSRALTALAKRFNIKYDAHNALADAQTCGKIIELCAKAAASKNEPEEITVSDLLKKTGLYMKRL